jgi:hypothetical protein
MRERVRRVKLVFFFFNIYTFLVVRVEQLPDQKCKNPNKIKIYICICIRLYICSQAGGRMIRSGGLDGRVGFGEYLPTL